MIRINQIGGRWVAECPYSEKDVVKSAGFRWDGTARYWYTTNRHIADQLQAKIENGGDLLAEARAELAGREAKKAASIESSRAQDSAIELPVPAGLAYLGYQKAGIAYGLSRPNVSSPSIGQSHPVSMPAVAVGGSGNRWPADTVRQPGSVAGPIVDAVTLEVYGCGICTRIIGADDFDRTAVTGAVLFNNNDAIVGLLAGANARQTDH